MNKMTKYYIQPNEQGLWKYIKDTTNSGSHDNSTLIPSKQDLKKIIGILRDLHNVHESKEGKLVS